jgi:hypothetical protein
MRLFALLATIALLFLAAFLTSCAPLVLGGLGGAAIEHEHYQWCQLHPKDRHCR